MTKNTKYYKTVVENKEYLYRDLTVIEVSFLDKITNETRKWDMACDLALIEKESNIPWPIKVQIGKQAYSNSTKCVNDDRLYEITINELRNSVQNDMAMTLITSIIRVFPSESITNLLSLTFMDLLELVCVAERMLGKQILKVGKISKTGMKLINPQDLSNDKSISDKIKELNSHLGVT